MAMAHSRKPGWSGRVGGLDVHRWDLRLGAADRRTLGLSDRRRNLPRLAHASQPWVRPLVLPELSAGYDDSVLSSSTSTRRGWTARSSASSAAVPGLRMPAWRGLISYSRAAGHLSGRGVAPGRVELAYDQMHLCDMGACSEVGFGFERGTALGHFTLRGSVAASATTCASRSCTAGSVGRWVRLLHPSAFVRDAPSPSTTSLDDARGGEACTSSP